MISPLTEELALRVDDLVCVPASIEIVLKGHWSLGGRDNVDIFLLRAPLVGFSQIVTVRGGKSYPTQSANSFVFGTVAESKMMLTWSGSIMITSSQTTPR